MKEYTILEIKCDKSLTFSEIHSIIDGKTDNINTIIAEKNHSNEYLIGILPFFKTIVVVNINNNENNNKITLIDIGILIPPYFNK